MNKQQIIDYVLETPGNTNSTILRQMLGEFADESNFFYNNNFDYGSCKLEDYLYQIEFNKWNYSLAKEAEKQFMGGRGSTVRNGNLIGRNFDYSYTPYTAFIIKCNGYNGRFSSIGMTSCVPPMTKDFMDNMEYDENFQLLPFFTTDGVNEKGVFCELNLLHQGDNGITTGTNPGKSNLCMTTVVRYILDYAKSAIHAIELLQKKNIFAPTGVVAGEYHFLIADNENTFEVEFINNEMIVINNFLNNKPIITSFYLNGYDGSKESLNPHAQGVERFNILSNHYNSSNNLEGMTKLMQLVFYNKTYEHTTIPFWYDEFNDYYPDLKLDLNINSKSEEYTPVVDKAIQYYEAGARDGKTRRTIHSIIYDLENLKLLVYPQNQMINKYELSFENWNILIYDGGNV